MSQHSVKQLSRRERQIMDLVYQGGEASAADILAAMPDPPTYSAIRALLRILEEKGHLTHREEGLKYVFLPTRPREKAGRQAMQQVVATFYDGSLEKAVAALFDVSEEKLSPERVKQIQALIRQAKKEGR